MIKLYLEFTILSKTKVRLFNNTVYLKIRVSADFELYYINKIIMNTMKCHLQVRVYLTGTSHYEGVEGKLVL